MVVWVRVVLSVERREASRPDARTCQAKSSDERRRRLELSTHAPQIRPSFMLFGGAGAVAVAVAVAARQAGASSAKASSSPPPNTTTPPDHHPHTHLHLSSSTHLSLPHHSHSPPSPPPPSIIHTPSPLAPGRTTPIPTSNTPP